MSRQQAESYVAALLLLQGSDFALTVAAENDLRPRLLSRKCRIGLVVALSDHGTPAVWSTRLTILDKEKDGAAFELSDIRRVEVSSEQRAVYVWAAANGVLFCFGLTPSAPSYFDLWNEAARETAQWP